MDEGATKGHWVVLQVSIQVEIVLNHYKYFVIYLRTSILSGNGYHHWKRNLSFTVKDHMIIIEYS